MIEFFEFMNGSTPLRVVAYLIFILVFTFIVFAGISDIIGKIRGIRKVETKTSVKVNDEQEK